MMLEWLDTWIHAHLMNPAFVWLQKIFHWNRFQLIAWFSKASVVSKVIVTALLLLSLGTVRHADTLIVSIWLFASFTYGGMAWAQWANFKRTRHFDLLSELSETFEQTGSYKLPTPFVLWAHEARRRRPTETGFCVFLLGLVLLNLLPDPKAVSIGSHVSFLLLFGYRLLPCIEDHLWDIDDIQPKDRLSLFEPQQDAA